MYKRQIVRALDSGAATSELWENATTKADGLRVPHPFADYLILEAIRETGGTALAVSDDEMIAAMYEMATAEGIFPAPEGAATLVGLKKLLHQRLVANQTQKRRPMKVKLVMETSSF